MRIERECNTLLDNGPQGRALLASQFSGASTEVIRNFDRRLHGALTVDHTTIPESMGNHSRSTSIHDALLLNAVLPWLGFHHHFEPTSPAADHHGNVARLAPRDVVGVG